MCRKIFLTLALAFIVSTSLLAQNKKDTIPAFIGYSYTPSLHWKVGNLLYHEGKLLKYTFDINSQSSLEGNFRLSKIGVRLGFSANIADNLIGKAYQYSGYLSLKNYWIKIQSSKISGTINWSDQDLPSRYLGSKKFTNEYFNVDLLKTSKKIAGDNALPFLGAYWGLGYTSFKLPIQLEVDENNAKAAYDTLFYTQVFSYIFGFDMLRQISMTGGNQCLYPGKQLSRFGIWVSTQDKVGVGKASISDYGAGMLEEINSKTLASSKFVTMMVQYNFSIGIRYIVKARPVFFVFAAGYVFEGAGIKSFSSKWGGDEKDICTTDPNVIFMNQGVTFKMYISWIGNK